MPVPKKINKNAKKSKTVEKILDSFNKIDDDHYQYECECGCITDLYTDKTQLKKLIRCFKCQKEFNESTNKLKKTGAKNEK
jgi:hypothetical protein